MDESLSYASDVKMYLAMLETAGLAVLDRAGCEVLVHTGAQAKSSFGDPTWIAEIADLFEPYRALLAARGVDADARAHLGGWMLGTALKRGAAGQRPIADVFLAEFRRRGYPVLPSLLAVADSLRRRSRLRRDGAATSAPPLRPQPLPAA